MAKLQQRKGGPVVFVVDDEAMLLDLAEMILKPAGYTVRTFPDAESALAQYASVMPRVVITDYAMGRMNGLDFARECRKLNPEQKIILVSGTVDEGIYAESEVKPDYFLPKPYDPHKLIAAVRKLAGE